MFYSFGCFVCIEIFYDIFKNKNVIFLLYVSWFIFFFFFMWVNEIIKFNFYSCEFWQYDFCFEDIIYIFNCIYGLNGMIVKEGNYFF